MGRKEYEKKLNKVREDTHTFLSYVSDKKHGPICKEPKKLCQNTKINLDAYLANAERDKKAFDPNINAALAKVAACVREYYDKLKKGQPHALAQKNLIRQSYDLVELLVRGKKKARQQKSTDPFGVWLIDRITIHRPLQVSVTPDNLEDFITGTNLGKMMRPLLHGEPARYTRDIADAVHDIHERFQGKSVQHYTEIITEDHVSLAHRIAERVRDRVEKMKPLDYNTLYDCSTRLRDTLVVLLANAFYAYTSDAGVAFEPIVEPSEIKTHLQKDLDCLRKLFLRTDRQQFGRRVLQTETPAVQVEDFSANDWLELKQSIRTRHKKRPPSSSSSTITTATTAALQSKQQTGQKQQQEEQQQHQQLQQQQRQLQWQRKPAAAATRKQEAWPLLQPNVRPNPRHTTAKALGRKQQNIQLLQDAVPQLARDIMKKACAKKAGSILLIDARNLGVKRHPNQDFQGRFRKLAAQASVLVRQQARPEDAGQAAKPFFVFVDQGDMADGPLRVEDIGDNAVRVRVACVKQQDGRRVDCHTKPTTSSSSEDDEETRKNPMDDYVLLSLYSILTRYYQDYVRREGGIAEGELNQMRQFLLRNPGAARYSPDVVREYRQRLHQVRQFNKKIQVPNTFVLSGDLFRDWQFAKQNR